MWCFLSSMFMHIATSCLFIKCKGVEVLELSEDNATCCTTVAPAQVYFKENPYIFRQIFSSNLCSEMLLTFTGLNLLGNRSLLFHPSRQSDYRTGISRENPLVTMILATEYPLHRVSLIVPFSGENLFTTTQEMQSP